MPRPPKPSPAPANAVPNLLSAAKAHLDETGQFYVLLIDDQIITNAPKFFAQALIMRRADLFRRIQEAENERQAERIVDLGGDS